MTSPFLGQIELFAADVVPHGWAKCAGQLLPISQNQALFALLGTTYGGDGQTNFALPDLRGRVPIGTSDQFAQGQAGGEEAHQLSTAEMPTHNHGLMADATSTTTTNQPSGNVLGQSSGRVAVGGPTFTANLYATGNPDTALNAAAIASSGGGQAHENRMPSLALNFCICISTSVGLFPPHP
jgi:microcystin-dependent protein